MEYTQQQVRLAIGVGQQTFRYWKATLSPLARKSGKSGLFTVGEMLALSVVDQLVRGYKMDVSALAPIAQELFALCSNPLQLSKSPTLICIDLNEGRLMIARHAKELPVDSTYVVVPVSRLWQRISETLMDKTAVRYQKELPIPLASVR